MFHESPVGKQCSISMRFAVIFYTIEDLTAYKSILLEVRKTQNELILRVSSGSCCNHILAYERIKRPNYRSI